MRAPRPTAIRSPRPTGRAAASSRRASRWRGRSATASRAASGTSRSARSAPPRAKRSRAPLPCRKRTSCCSHHRRSCTDEPPLLPRLAARSYTSGFMNRLAAEIGGRSAIAFGNQLPVAFRGPAAVANVALMAPKPAVDARESALIAEMYRGSTLEASVAEGFAAREAMMKELGEEMAAANRNAVTARGFETQVKRIARLMRGDYRLAFVDVGGWDTHVGEGGVQGQLATRLEALGGGLATFAGAMGDARRGTVVLVISEVGRTFRENRNHGTDHGHGTVYWALGGALSGGRVAGEQLRVARGTLFQDRDYPVLNDYRALLGGLFARIYGLKGEALARVFPGATPQDLALV